MVRAWATPALEPLCCVDVDSITNSSGSDATFTNLVNIYMLISACTAGVSVAISTFVFCYFIHRRAKYSALLLFGSQRAAQRAYGATGDGANETNSVSSDDALVAANSEKPQHLALHTRISLAIAHQTGFGRAQSILLWLLISDFLAVLAVLIRGAVWYSGALDVSVLPILPANSSGSVVPSIDESMFVRFEVFCITTSFCIQFFYTAGFGWAIIFAYDTVRLFDHRKALVIVYHTLCWLLAAVLCVTGLCLLYLPNLRMCSDNLSHTMPHVLATAIPLLLAMVAVPIITNSAEAACERRLLMMSSEFQSGERRDFESARLQLRLSVSTLFICWSPNLAYWLLHVIQMSLASSGASWDHESLGYALVATWFITAITNPLQAALNMLVYSGTVQQMLMKIKSGFSNWNGSSVTARFREYERLRGTASLTASVSGTSTANRVDFSLSKTSMQPATVRRVVHDLDEYLANSQ